MTRAILTDNAPQPIGPYSQAVSAAGLLFLSGQIGLDPKTGRMVEGSVAKQAEQVCRNLLAVLAAAGLGPESVVKTTIYLTDMDNFPEVNRIYGSFFGTAAPARATVGVAALPLGALVEVEAVASVVG